MFRLIGRVIPVLAGVVAYTVHKLTNQATDNKIVQPSPVSGGVITTTIARITEPIELLDVWGEGRIVTSDGMITGFLQAKNLNEWNQKISNGPNEKFDIPNLIPVDNYENPKFPIGDGLVSYITLMGAPITKGTAQEMYRVLDKKCGVVMLYNPSEEHITIFEENKGKLIYKPKDPLNHPFDQPTIRPVRIYGFPEVNDKDEL